MLDENASTASSNSINADQVNPGGLSSCKRSFLGHMHT